MIDLHCHILPTIDDGSRNIEQSIKMAKIAVKDGITQIVTTPHITDDQGLKQLIENKSLELKLLLAEEHIPLKILTGGEIPVMMDPTMVHQFSMNQNPYLLIELPHGFVPNSTKDYLSKLKYNNFWPIIAHPERNQMIIENPSILFDLLDSNIFVQVTAGSLTGMFGNEAKRCARFLVKKGVVTILASDAHDHEYRPPIMSAGLKVAKRLIGKLAANKLVNENPLSIIKGEKIDRL